MAQYKNTYWLLRHGRSLANEAGLCVSTKEQGILPQWSLAPLGQEQAIAAGKLLAEQLKGVKLDQPLLVVVSPFSRTIETATLAAGQVGVTPDEFQVSDLLLERNFGSGTELQPYDAVYEPMWAEDAKDLDCPAGPNKDGESINMVIARLKALFKELEDAHTGRQILLVSHGDTLSICQAALSTVPCGEIKNHYKDCHFENCQLKRIN